MPQRIEQLKVWLASLPGLNDFTFEPASEDASFRRYFRICTTGKNYIAMDAPTEKEDSKPFVQIAATFESIGLNVPHIHAQDLTQGFMLLQDMGSELYLDKLTADTVDRLYGDALGALVTLQACGPLQNLPHYDRILLMQEMALFRDWLLTRELELTLTSEEQSMLDSAFNLLADNALQQPQVCVHRDYHSCNLMATAQHNPGILDFQDALIGPVTYDLVSLLRDCYINWTEHQVCAWSKGYFELAVQSGVLQAKHEGQFQMWFDLMGVQRHLKASGIFARLNQRDGKPGYLKDIPRTLGYIVTINNRNSGLKGLVAFIQKRVLPLLK
ncbi:MAG: phosphotransferase [Candidatus Thiodiazotropha sp. (ex Lucinoma aequizonata)]|nr:phosphotransferase [Candidatus Thiodiazotropha sp. (ex Lucinoma aequizonata)]MCU7887949.1 phosphotransferase [Candidatus Thiodiazotropha sp. (ex Lucinoma aequizonata)]MCU7894574.1 phosphotransferase [Candidatus Thiodiazotropha sp. (ex Lucinoma aequizonata)]MCU7899837.1 phosphotransferase [Candidatus Thiodiazotropha sp. (ex Lucinoma aequizonata)]MCU7901166.1 phosphotransferase [Candidatus Thiodiazotropha sp. (ex Lucinoma aequizonata)]